MQQNLLILILSPAGMSPYFFVLAKFMNFSGEFTTVNFKTGLYDRERTQNHTPC